MMTLCNDKVVRVMMTCTEYMQEMSMRKWGMTCLSGICGMRASEEQRHSHEESKTTILFKDGDYSGMTMC